jgi:hypothetical protein
VINIAGVNFFSGCFFHLSGPVHKLTKLETKSVAKKFLELSGHIHPGALIHSSAEDLINVAVRMWEVVRPAPRAAEAKQPVSTSSGAKIHQNDPCCFCDTKHSNTQPACSSSSSIISPLLHRCVYKGESERDSEIVFLCLSHAKKVIYTRMTIYLRHEGGENLTLLRHNSMTEQLTFCMTQVARDPPTLKILQYLC